MQNNSVIWVHGDCLSQQNPCFVHYPQAPALYVFDDALLDSWRISLKRIVFMYECLLDLPVTIRRGDVAAEVSRFASEHTAQRIVTTDSPSPRFGQIALTLQRSYSLETLPTEPFFDTDRHLDLGRFSRYWRTAEKYLFD